MKSWNLAECSIAGFVWRSSHLYKELYCNSYDLGMALLLFVIVLLLNGAMTDQKLNAHAYALIHYKKKSTVT